MADIPIELFRCPACKADGGLRWVSSQAECPQCGGSFAGHDGYLDLLDSDEDTGPIASSAEQRLMESELMARIYDRVWRPTFVRLLAGGGAQSATGGFTGEFFIIKNALAMEDHPGPWLDLSCGPGMFSRAMAAAAPGDWVLGLDISHAMLDVAVKRSRGYGNAVFARGDAHEIPLASEQFGGVNTSGALHVYLDPDAVFSEVFRVLRPGGVFVGSTFAKSANLVGRTIANIAGIRRFDPLELRGWLSRIGFADYEEIRLGGAFIFRVRKP